MARRPAPRTTTTRRQATATAVTTAPPPPPPAEPDAGLGSRLGAEALGTFWLVLAGCGSAIFAANFTSDNQQVGIGFLGVALAFGLTVLTMAIAVGGISGGHFNPAVTIGLACAGRIQWRLVPPYVITQLLAGTVAGTVLFLIASGRPGFNATDSGFATNGYGDRSPGGYSLGAVFLTEVLLTAVFLAVIIAATGKNATKSLAPIGIGFALTLIHLVSIPIDNTSVNPARSLGVAWFAGLDALGQVWVFLVAPVIGGIIAGLAFRGITGLRNGLGGEGNSLLPRPRR